MSDWSAIERAIADATGKAFSVESERPIGGGCINDARVIEGGGQPYFVKLNRAEMAPVFAAEADALREIAHTRTVRVPQPIAHGRDGGRAFLALAYIEMGPLHGDAAEVLGRQLAAMHRVAAPAHGWHRDNVIGATPQANAREVDWPAFFRDRRIHPLMRRAHDQGIRFAEADRLLDRIPQRLQGHKPVPSLLHGDLWGGNAASDPHGQPVIFDPASYYGDRETDIAFTEMFGGFGPRFYAAYREAWPLQPGYETRRELYNLYHLLNHAILFGGSYVGSARESIRRLSALSEWQ